MKSKTDAAAPAEKTAPASTVQLACTVLENGLLIGGLHHAAGKTLHVPEAEAKALADLGKLRIDGV